MSENSHAGLYFLAVVVILYAVAWVFNPGAVMPALQFAWNIIVNIIPVFVLIFAIMAAFNYFVSPKAISRYIGKTSGVKRWIIAIIGGIVSTGPIYMWYPLLKDLKKKGVGYGFIAAFLYNRAVKIPLMPMLIFYFGLTFTAILTVVMIVFSVIQGIIFEKLERGGFV
jgi:uncharacterized membrane protein YraQ (UPF0718 family)